MLVAIVLAAGLSALYASSKPKEYTATASILFRPDVEAVEGATRSVNPERDAATNEGLLSLDVVAAGAARRLGGPVTAEQVRSDVEVVPSPEADIVDIKTTTTDPRLSARMATAYGDAFVNFRRSSARELLDEAITGARNVLRSFSDSERAGQPGLDLRERLNQLETARSFRTGGVELVQRATVPTEASAPKPLRSGILGGILGAVLGCSIAAIRVRSDRRIRSPEAIEQAFGRPVIAEIPRSNDLARGDMGPIGGEEAEAFRMLRSSLRYFSVDSEIRALLVASAASGEGKTTVARRLAETMATMGDSVVLVEADMHRPSSFLAAQGGPDHGLSVVLAGHDLNEALIEVPVPSKTGDDRVLTVLQNGPMPPNPSELLESARMADLLTELRSRYEMVIIDSPPLPVLSDALSLVNRVDGILAVSALGRTTPDGVRDFLRLVTLHSGSLLGVVVNFAARADRSAAYYYQQRS